MIEIFVCEDDEKQLARNVDYINRYLMMEQLDMKITLATHDPEVLIDYVKKEKVQGLYFLDVNLQHKMSGIVLGAEIRRYDPSGSIVFITTHAEMTYLTFMYKVEALDYIVKDDFTDLQQRIIDCIVTVNERYINENSVEHDKFQVQMGDKVISEEVQNVLFFETACTVHKIVMHTLTRSVEFYGKIKDIPIEHPSFYRCHNSTVVNVDNIEKIDRKSRTIIMKNGATCFASVRYLKSLRSVVSKVEWV